MSCREIESELIAYHFGTVAPEAREQIEAHLPSCAACVGAYVALKRGFDSPGDARPSAAARARLRAAVAQKLRPPWRWWERPLAFATALLVVALSIAATWQLGTGEGAPPHAVRSMR
jgi:anti-sigma factor RsiW